MNKKLIIAWTIALSLRLVISAIAQDTRTDVLPKTMINKKDYLKKADELIKSSSIYAVSIYIPLLDKYSELKAVVNSNLLEFWAYLITIAMLAEAPK